MSPTRRGPRRASPKDDRVFADARLAEIGLCPGDAVRFRRRDDEHWTYATVARRERDGSLGVHDRDGAARAIPLDLVEVQGRGPRGGGTWESLVGRVAADQQLRLL